MHQTEKALLKTFSTVPEKSFSTTELVAQVFADDYHALREHLHSEDANKKRTAQRHKAQLHRKLLYHLNKLLEKNILKVSDIHARGEKAYQLASNAPEVILQDSTDTITITRHDRPKRFTTIDEDANRVYARSTALHTIDAYAVNATQYPGIAHLRSELIHAYPHVNDAICIVNAQSLLEAPQEALSSGIAQLHADTQDYNVAITLHINIAAQQIATRHLAFFRTFALHKPRRLYVVLSGSIKDFHSQHSSIEHILQILSRDKVKINIHNTAVRSGVHFYGEAGAYVITKRQTQILLSEGAVIIANTSLLLNCQEIRQANEHTRILKDASMTLLAHIAAQRRLASKALGGLQRLGSLRKQLSAPTCILRYYNFDLDENFSTLLSELRTQAQAFSEIHNRIYGSCGVPLDFELQLSTGFIHYSQLPSRNYKKRPIQTKSDLQNTQLAEREHILRVLDTDRIRIFRDSPYTSKELFNEICYILEHYSFPLLCYDLKALQTTLSLSEFLT